MSKDIKSILEQFKRIDSEMGGKSIPKDSHASDMAQSRSVLEGKLSALIEDKRVREERAQWDKPFGFIRSLNEDYDSKTLSLLAKIKSACDGPQGMFYTSNNSTNRDLINQMQSDNLIFVKPYGERFMQIALTDKGESALGLGADLDEGDDLDEYGTE